MTDRSIELLGPTGLDLVESGYVVAGDGIEQQAYAMVGVTRGELEGLPGLRDLNILLLSKTDILVPLSGTMYRGMTMPDVETPGASANTRWLAYSAPNAMMVTRMPGELEKPLALVDGQLGRSTLKPDMVMVETESKVVKFTVKKTS